MNKKQFIAARLAISMESNEGYMLGAGKSLAHREADTMEEVYRKNTGSHGRDIRPAVAVGSFPHRRASSINNGFQRSDTH